MLSEEEREEIYEKTLPKLFTTEFSSQIYIAFKKGRITEGEFYNAMGLHRIEGKLEDMIGK